MVSNVNCKKFIFSENEVCYRPGNSLHLLPFKLKTPELRKTCSKLQGRLHGYSVKDEFDRITKLMTLPNSLKVISQNL